MHLMLTPGCMAALLFALALTAGSSGGSAFQWISLSSLFRTCTVGLMQTALHNCVQC